MSLLVVLAAALIPLVIGFVWFHPKTFGTVWMNAAGLTPEAGKTTNMPLIFGLTFVFSFILAFGMQFIVVHQTHMQSLLLNTPNADVAYKELMDIYGHNYRSFGHGAFHGIEASILVVLPLLAINALFERKGFKYIAVNFGYWLVTFALMGGVVCAWS
jgi:hypothetical protein